MADRDDANLKQFKSRSQQPKLIAAPNIAKRIENAPPNVSVYLVFDSGFGGVSDQIDDNRFKYMGTSTELSRYGLPRQIKHECMRSAFNM